MAGLSWIDAATKCAPLCAGLERVYLLIVNTPARVRHRRGAGGSRGGRAAARRVTAAAAGDQHGPLPGGREVAEAYRELHLPADDAAPACPLLQHRARPAYELTEDSAAEAILAQALDTVDFPAVIEAAYRDGVRLFMEMGPGASCTRMIGAILGDRPHRARSACAPGADGVSARAAMLAHAVRGAGRRGSAAACTADDVAPSNGAAGNRHASIAIPVGGEPFRPPITGGPRLAQVGGCARASAPRLLFPSPTAAAASPAGVTPLLDRTAATRAGPRRGAHAAFLRYTDAVRRT